MENRYFTHLNCLDIETKWAVCRWSDILLYELSHQWKEQPWIASQQQVKPHVASIPWFFIIMPFQQHQPAHGVRIHAMPPKAQKTSGFAEQPLYSYLSGWDREIVTNSLCHERKPRCNHFPPFQHPPRVPIFDQVMRPIDWLRPQISVNFWHKRPKGRLEIIR